MFLYLYCQNKLYYNNNPRAHKVCFKFCYFTVFESVLGWSGRLYGKKIFNDQKARKGIVQPFELGGETRLIRSAVNIGCAASF